MGAGVSIAQLCRELQGQARRVLVVGSPGSDRWTPTSRLLQALADSGTDYPCLTTDLALPLFGVPGALNYGFRSVDGWLSQDREALCTLDSSRFRLPLVTGLHRLLERNPGKSLILQAPGLARGVAGAELLAELSRCARIDTVLVCARETHEALTAALHSCNADIVTLYDCGEGCLGKQQRAEQRSRMWRDHMGAAVHVELSMDTLQVLGTPPPLTAVEAWRGRQIALLHNGNLATMGQVRCLQGRQLRVELAQVPGPCNQLLLRDAIYSEGQLRSARPYRKPEVPPPEPPKAGFLSVDTSLGKEARCGPIPVARIGSATACLVNGVFGDPLLKLQLHHRRRSLLFDLGDPGRMAARTAHQVSDVFFSHTHADHVGGFFWFLRSRIGDLPPCRCYGPPGLAQQIAGMVGGILWDRVEDRAPRFDIREWHDDHLQLYQVVAGQTQAMRLQDLPLVNGLLWREPGFSVRATRLDHRTPVLAYAYEPDLEVKVRRERLQALGLQSGRWLQELKHRFLRGQLDAPINLPDGESRTVDRLKEELLLVTPGQKLVYATDFADTAGNRERLEELARGAHTLFCEASFMLEHADQARRTQHLTTLACGEIANGCGVGQLLPFHFSKRYIKRTAEVYREIQQTCKRTVVPGFV